MKQIALMCVALVITFSATSQNTKKNIAGLFSQWENKYPGGVVLVAHKNQLIFSKAYGLANIPYNIPNTAETSDYMPKKFIIYLSSLREVYRIIRIGRTNFKF